MLFFIHLSCLGEHREGAWADFPLAETIGAATDCHIALSGSGDSLDKSFPGSVFYSWFEASIKARLTHGTGRQPTMGKPLWQRLSNTWDSPGLLGLAVLDLGERSGGRHFLWYQSPPLNPRLAHRGTRIKESVPAKPGFDWHVQAWLMFILLRLCLIPWRLPGATEASNNK